MSTLSNWNFPEGHKNNLRPMIASRWPLFVNLGGVPKGQIHLRYILKIKQYDAIDKKYVRRRVWFTRDYFPGSQKVLMGKKHCTKRDADDDKQTSMTMNEREGSFQMPLYGISRGFAETSRSTCQNICRVRAEYVLSTRKMGTRLWAPFPWGRGL